MDSEEIKKTSGLRPPWKKGECGNPKGRPVGAKTGLRARLKQLMDKALPAEIVEYLKTQGIKLEDPIYGEALTHVLVGAGIKGDISALKEVFGQIESPLPKEIVLDAKEFNITIENKDANNA